LPSLRPLTKDIRHFSARHQKLIGRFRHFSIFIECSRSLPKSIRTHVACSVYIHVRVDHDQFAQYKEPSDIGSFSLHFIYSVIVLIFIAKSIHFNKLLCTFPCIDISNYFRTTYRKDDTEGNN